MMTLESNERDLSAQVVVGGILISSSVDDRKSLTEHGENFLIAYFSKYLHSDRSHNTLHSEIIFMYRVFMY